MTNTTIAKSIIAALLLGTTALRAQTPPSACPLGHTPGYGRSLDATQRAERRAERQQYLAELRQKQGAGTLTAEEQAWLRAAEQRGGVGIGSAPCGSGAGKGAGAGNGPGQRKRQGLRIGNGPCAQEGTCPNGNGPRRNGWQ